MFKVLAQQVAFIKDQLFLTTFDGVKCLKQV